jgi:cell division protein FtsQ
MRRLIIAATAGGLAGLLLLAVWLGGWTDARYWPIRWLEVAGELERVTAPQVRAAAAVEARHGFFGVDIERMRSAIESLPWVAGATVARRWPDALHIVIRERRAVARWNGGALVGASGETFEVAGTGGMQGLVQLEGPDSRFEDVFSRWREMAPRLNAAGLDLRRLSLDPRGAWRLVLRSGTELLLGRESVDARLSRYLEIRSGLRSVGPIARIDLRYPNGVAVTPRAAAAEGDPDRLAADDARPQPTGAQRNHG